MERVIIGRGSAHKVKVDVDKLRSVIQWEFVSTQYDIGFGIYHKPEEESGKKNKNELVGIIENTRTKQLVVADLTTHLLWL